MWPTGSVRVIVSATLPALPLSCLKPFFKLSFLQTFLCKQFWRNLSFQTLLVGTSIGWRSRFPKCYFSVLEFDKNSQGGEVVGSYLFGSQQGYHCFRIWFFPLWVCYWRGGENKSHKVRYTLKLYHHIPVWWYFLWPTHHMSNPSLIRPSLMFLNSPLRSFEDRMTQSNRSIVTDHMFCASTCEV